MNADAVNGLIARCLLEPGYLDRLRDGFEVELDLLQVDDATRAELTALDLAQVRRFGGLISKVQHNDTWERFPLTRALLKCYGMELEVFAAYRNRHLDLLRGARPTRDAKTLSFLSFLADHLDGIDPAACPGLVDVLVHERWTWEVGRELAEPDRRQVVESARERVVPRDALRVAALRYHPFDIASALRDDSSAVADLAPRPTYLGYWGRRRADDVAVLELDAVTASVLACVDGVRSAAEVVTAAHVLLPEVGREDLAAALHQAVARDVVAVVEPVGSK